MPIVIERYHKDRQLIKIQTLAIGTQTIEDIDRIVESYKMAQATARAIMEAFLECF